MEFSKGKLEKKENMFIFDKTLSQSLNTSFMYDSVYPIVSEVSSSGSSWLGLLVQEWVSQGQCLFPGSPHTEGNLMAIGNKYT